MSYTLLIFEIYNNTLSWLFLLYCRYFFFLYSGILNTKHLNLNPSVNTNVSQFLKKTRNLLVLS